MVPELRHWGQTMLAAAILIALSNLGDGIATAPPEADDLAVVDLAVEQEGLAFEDEGAQ